MRHRHLCVAALGGLVVWAVAAAADERLSVVVPMKDLASACYRTDYDAAHLRAHPGQRTTEVLLSLLRRSAKDGSVEMRLRFRRTDQPLPIHAVGDCVDEVTDAAAPPHANANTSVSCMARGGLGGSAEEGGDFDIVFAEGGPSLLLRTVYGFTGWAGTDQTKPPVFVRLNDQDLLFRLKKVPADRCRDMERAVAVD